MQAGGLPLVLNESDVYREYAPPAWARHAIACFWTRRGDGSPVRVLPDTCTDIVWHAGDGAMVAGPDSQARTAQTSVGRLTIGARLLPGAGGPALGLKLAEVCDMQVPVDALGFDRGGELSNACDPDCASTVLVRSTLRLVAGAPPDAAVQAAVTRLLDPRQRVDELAALLGFSERQLRRRFLAAVGYGPKTLQRVLRLRRFMADVRGWATGTADTEGLAGAAASAGYADQAHLARECRALTGLTPGQLVASA